MPILSRVYSKLQPNCVAQRVGRLVEGHDVVADVHVAVPVDPLRQHRGAMAVEGRGEVEGRQLVGEGHVALTAFAERAGDYDAAAIHHNLFLRV